jgi:signal transduction histidine kinase
MRGGAVPGARGEDGPEGDAASLLTRALDVLVGDASARSRLADVLLLVARTVGARRAAVLTSEPERRVAVSVGGEEETTPARMLADWLDQHAPRSQADRAATRRALISFVPEPAGAAAPPRPDASAAPSSSHFALLEVASPRYAVLGFEMVDEDDVLALADRLPPNIAREAATALALVGEQLRWEEELATYRARDAERRRFATTVAHDLRTPLTGLSGYLDLILGGRVDDPAVQREFLERSRRIVESMDELIGDLLEISQLDSGNLGLEIGPFSIADVGKRVVAAVAPLALERAIELRTALPPRIRAATGDRRHVERILMNLLGNAIKYTNEGGLVEIAGQFEGSVALIAIRDDGPGIGADDRIRIFERFYRMSSHAQVTGTGLGLPIARDLARAMGGDLGLASVPGTGTCFIVALPGPASTDPEVLHAALRDAIEAEEMRLEETAVLRAAQGAGRQAQPRVDPARGRVGPLAIDGARAKDGELDLA